MASFDRYVAPIDGQDISNFRVVAARLEALNPLWQTIELSTPAGNPRLRLSRPALISPATPMTDLNGVQSLQHTHKPAVGGIPVTGTDSDLPLVTLHVPVMRQEALQYILSVAMAPDSIGRILNAARVPATWVGVVVDSSGQILARTNSVGEPLGHRASETLRKAIAQRPVDFHLGHTLAGLQVETVARGLPGTGGWTVAFGIPEAALRWPVQRALLILSAACLVSLVLSAALAALVTQDMIQRREDERARADLALRASEERQVMAVEAAELGTWRWDIEQDRFEGSARCRAMLELQPQTLVGVNKGWRDAIAAVHPDDQVLLDEAWQRCVTESGHFQAEFRVRQRSGGERWVRANGRILDGGKDEPRSLQGVMDDITSRKRTETERLDLLRRLAMAQENERQRISRDLHDQVGQTVIGLSLGLKALERERGVSPVRIHSLHALVAEISRDIHRVAADLRPSALDDLGLLRALQGLAANCAEVSGLMIDVQAVASDSRLSSEVETVIYRSVQEALTNVIKHADAHAVSVLLERSNDQLRVIIDDDGTGFDVDDQVHGTGAPHLGLSGMRERLTLVGGSMAIESVPGSGTTLFIQIPAISSQPALTS